MFHIDHLRPSDIPAALAISTQAGWNQLDRDWTRILSFGPNDGVAGRVDGRLIATATLMRYEPGIAWVGMVLVDQATRGQGYGAQILDAVMALAQKFGIQTLGLDATDAGRPLYLKRGFVDAIPVRRRVLEASAKVAPDRADHSMRIDDWSNVLRLDRDVLGFDRSQLLARLRDESICHVTRDANRVTGFGLRRAGRLADQIGPVVARTTDDTKSLIRSLAGESASDDARNVLMDTFPNSDLDPWLDAMNFKTSRNLVRMTKGPNPLVLMSNSSVIAGAGLELG